MAQIKTFPRYPTFALDTKTVFAIFGVSFGGGGVPSSIWKPTIGMSLTRTAAGVYTINATPEVGPVSDWVVFPVLYSNTLIGARLNAASTAITLLGESAGVIAATDPASGDALALLIVPTLGPSE